ncbi:NIPSNAP family protein [Brevundimonas sp.]|uniref:NIPSNAP family protein n=1 Tax=Brevundimonas sp. TaxID=1871086 RepID=UPI0027377D57|nr:NIPSNAP family protein [Brevundimonas sp.]
MIVSPVVELRQYTLHPGKRDVLIDLFEREFVEGQESVGMTLIGQFRDLDDPDRFVWLRGFPDMEARRLALEAFYFGPVWQGNRDTANPTMIDSDNVLLLKPLDEASGFTPGERGPRGASGPGAGRIIAGVHALKGSDDPLPERFRREAVPVLRDVGAASLAVLVTDGSANTFPRLPVREGEPVLAWFAAFVDPMAADSIHHVFTEQSIQRLRLEPTARSRLHG